MADSYGQADIRGLDVDRLAKGFADEAIVLKQYCNVVTTGFTELRYYSKTAGFLDSTDSTGSTDSKILDVAFRAQPDVIGQSWTRNTAYVKKFFVESELISNEDIKGADIDLIATTVRDLVRAVEHQVDLRIYNVLTESDTPSNIQDITITHEWDDTANAVPVSDLLTAREYLRNYNYEANGAILLMRPDAARFLINHLIAVKGSSIPNFASDTVRTGVVMELLGLRLVESSVCTSDKAVVFVPNRAVTWKQFAPISSTIIDEPMIGKKIRVMEEGEAILTDPKAVVYLANVGPS